MPTRPQGSQRCCCPGEDPVLPPDTPLPCEFPCLDLTIAGMASALCGCPQASFYNTTFRLVNASEFNWHVYVTPTLDYCYCGFTDLSVNVTLDGGIQWVVRATLSGINGVTVVWSAELDEEPDCSLWDGLELAYNAAESSLDDGFDNLQVDPTGATVMLTATEEAECNEGQVDCPENPSPCSGMGTTVDDLCNDPAFVPSQLRVTLPAGNWIDRSTILGGQVACNNPEDCPEGDFILDYDGSCGLTWTYTPGGSGNCRLASIVATLQSGTGFGPYASLTDPADPELRLVVSVNWVEQVPSSFPGSIPTTGHNLFTLCVDDDGSCDADHEWDCWMGMEEFEMGFHYCSGLIACAWEGLTNFTSDTPPRFCTKPDSMVPITAQFLP